MAADFISAVWSGPSKFNSVTKDIENNVHKATVAGIKANQRVIVAAIRANLKGEPRWSQHGKNRVTGNNFQVQGTQGQHNSPRSGGPGRMTGDLYKGVGGVKKPRKESGTWYGGVGVGKMENNVKKGVWEAKFPYFKPAIEKALPKLAGRFDKDWDKAIHKMGGSFL